MKRTASLIAIAVIAFACREQDTVTEPPLAASSSPASAIQAAAGAETTHFHFLPPLAPAPEPTGTFHPDMSPVVVVCELDGADPGGCAAEVRRFTVEGHGPARVRVDEEEEHYIVAWQTGEDGLDEGATYRIRVLPAGPAAADLPDPPAIGSIDVRPAGGGGNAGRGPANGQAQGGDDWAVFRNGSTLAIRFRIERGVFCGSGDCGADEVTAADGGTVVTNTGLAGVWVAPDALPEGLDEVSIRLERVELEDASACLPLPGDQLQLDGCYALSTDPADVVFAEPVVIGIRLDPSADPSDILVHKFEPDDPAAGVVRLARVPAPFLAGDAIGGLTRTFSTAGLAESSEPVVIELVAGDGQEGPAGSTLGVPVTVTVTDLRVGPDPTPGVTVTYAFNGAAGGVTLAESTTDANGQASETWTLGAPGGTNEVQIFKADGATQESNVVTVKALGRGLISRWSGEGDFTDSVGDNHLAVQGGIGFTTGVVGSQAFAFTRDAATATTGGWAYAHPTPDIDAMDRFTLATWVHLHSWGPADQIQRFVSTFGGKAVLRQEPQTDAGLPRILRFYMNTGATPEDAFEGFSKAVLQTSCWHHVAATFDGTTQVLYLDGQELGRRDIDGTAPVGDDGVFLSNSDDGAGWPPYTGPNANIEKLAGELDEVEIYNEVVSGAGIAAKWSVGVGRCGNPEPTGTVHAEVSASDRGLPGVRVDVAALGIWHVTDAFGVADIGGVPFGTHTVVPSLDGWWFNPATHEVEPTTGDPTVLARFESQSGQWLRVDAGLDHTCAISIDETLYCWGRDFEGQLGNGGGSSVDLAVSDPVPGLTGVLDVSAGALHTCAIDGTGAAWCWGSNWKFFDGPAIGKLGTGGTSTQEDAPAQVAGGLSFNRISAGDGHTCGLTAATGQIYCWGDNESGQLGDGGATTHSLSPIAVDVGQIGTPTWIDIAAGLMHTCAVTDAGEAYCWGDNVDGRLGIDPDLYAALSRPTHPVTAPASGFQGGWSSISAGAVATCGVDHGGNAYCWGLNSSGVLGTGSTALGASHTPQPLASTEQFDRVDHYGSHACGVTSLGEVHCWGDNSFGQLGRGFPGVPEGTPAAIVDVGGPGATVAFLQVTAGANHTCALTAVQAATGGQHLYCWGASDSGQVGVGVFASPNPAPRLVFDP